jgi:hypothetical protein
MNLDSDDVFSAVTPESALNRNFQNYYDSERQKTNDAFRDAQMPAKERELADKIKALVTQAVKDRQFTRTKVLAELGLKTVTGSDGKVSLARLTDDERRAMMSPVELNRSEASKAYAARAKAAFEGTTKLPSFLQKEVDTQKENESQVLKTIMGEDFEKSAAGQQAVEQLKKREESARQNIQDQDKTIAVTGMSQMNALNKASSQNRIAGYDNLTSYIAQNVNSSTGLLGYLQQERNKALQNTLDKLSRKRSMISQVLTLGGLLGGQAAAQYGGNNRSSDVGTTDYFKYQPSSSGNYSGYNISGTTLPTLSEYKSGNYGGN